MGDWTLRTPGHREIDCASVTLAGEVYDFGTTVGPPGDSIRPALHIKFSQACASGLIKYAGKITSENTVEEIPIEDNTAIVNNIENGIKDVADSEEDIVLEKLQKQKIRYLHSGIHMK